MESKTAAASPERTRKLEQLSQLLISKEKDSRAAEALMASELGQALFAKAPAEFIQSRTLDQLAQTVASAKSCFDHFVTNSERVQISISNSAAHTVFQVALSDRPFTINTIQEFLLAQDLELRVLLHPILFLKNGMRVSFIYFECSQIAPERHTELRNDLFLALSDLVLATEDYGSMSVAIETAVRLFEDSKQASSYPEAERKELADFVRWLLKDGLVITGSAEWLVQQSNVKAQDSFGQLASTPTSQFGIFRTLGTYREGLLRECQQDAQALLNSQNFLSSEKLLTSSLIHRRERLESFSFKKFSSDGKCTSIYTVLGLLTSRTRFQETSGLPLLRRKLEKILELEQLLPNTHSYKNIQNIIDNLPKAELFRLNVDEIWTDVQQILEAQRTLDAKVNIRASRSGRSATILVALPRGRFNEQIREQLESALEQVVGAAPGAASCHVSLHVKPLALFYFNLPTKNSEALAVTSEKVESLVKQLTTSWRERLEEALRGGSASLARDQVIERYSEAFSPEYQAMYSIAECLQDISAIESLNAQQPVRIGMSESADPLSGFFTLTVYNLGAEITISQAFPILENAGLLIVNERSAKVSLGAGTAVFIHRFLVRPRHAVYVDPNAFERTFAPGLVQIFSGQTDNDLLNSLLLTANLDVRAISLLRTYCSYIWQISSFASREVILDSLASVPNAAALLWNMFEVRFNPALSDSLEDRQDRFNAVLQAFRITLRDVTDITKDRILRIFANIMEATVRTSFYENRSTIAIKIESEKVEIMPQPRPLFEIFIYSPAVEGIHLRGGSVARGGIRWSDRHEDYRSEVLGLMKTQKIKNALIVPTGAKGGFIVKQKPSQPDGMAALALESYKEFIRSLLTISDNRIDGEVKHPERIVCYDKLDPYLVVAADKGTATYSDTANKIAVEEFNFWLGDAFASGGSNGYDHKKFAITARGAWDCVIRHFNDAGMDMSKPFSVVGIGDLSGDVFGNGMLLSDKIKLIAAFNHKHIFIDPDPDPAASFAERKRMFNLPRSQWSDYTKSAMSKGAAIYGRLDKEIQLSPEARKALDLPSDAPAVMNGEQLITYILKAPCDLLWNGGIGTYVKSSQESHADVNDGTNDAVRVNSTELRCKVVGEGGNLGFTQLARIEFNRAGGRINTDAIDNSAGVDLSDHEVNFKILFAGLLRNNKLTIEARNQILKEMADEACELVVNDNRNQCLLLTMSSTRSPRNMEYTKSLIRELARTGFVNRTLECLPDDEEIGRRANRKLGLTRPELAVLCSAVKMWVKQEIRQSDIASDPQARTFLINYFPLAMRERFRDEILNHPLAGEIVATQVTNNLVDQMGVTFVHRTSLNYNISACDVVRYHMAAEAVLDAAEVRRELRLLDTHTSAPSYLAMLQQLNRALRQLTAWFIAYHPAPIKTAELVDLYKSALSQALGNWQTLVESSEREQVQLKIAEYIKLGISAKLSERLGLLPQITPIFGMLWAAAQSKRPLTEVASIYSLVLEETKIGRILQSEDQIDANTGWEGELLISSFGDIRRHLSKLASNLLATKNSNTEELRALLDKHRGMVRLKHLIRECRDQAPSVAALAVIARQFEATVN